MAGLLERIINDETTINESESLFEKEIELHSSRKEKFDWAGYLGIDNYEATAYANGATIENIISLRKDVCPDHCCICTKPLDYRKYGWIFISNESGDNQIKRIK